MKKDRSLFLVKKARGINERDKFNFAFVTQYNPHANQVKKMLKKHWHILRADPILKDSIPKSPIVIFRKAQNLKDILAPSLLPPVEEKINKGIFNFERPKGFFKCGICKACEYQLRKNIGFKSNVTNKKI